MNKVTDVATGEIMVINHDGVNLGRMPFHQAKQLAIESELSLIEIDKPGRVFKIMDEGKWKYEHKKKEHKRKQHSQSLKEMRFSISIDPHDQMTKVNHVKDFIAKGHNVKVSVQIRGREKANPLAADLKMRMILCDIGVDPSSVVIKKSPSQVHTVIAATIVSKD